MLLFVLWSWHLALACAVLAPLVREAVEPILPINLNRFGIGIGMIRRRCLVLQLGWSLSPVPCLLAVGLLILLAVAFTVGGFASATFAPTTFLLKLVLKGGDLRLESQELLLGGW